MTRNRGKIIGIAFILTLGLVVQGSALAAPPAVPLKLLAFAVNLNATHPSRASGFVEISIERWSMDEERSDLLRALAQGQDSLLRSLREAPRVGYIRTPDSIGWDLHYAHATPDPNGGTRIFLGTDRRIAFWESFNNTRSLDYPFTLIEIHLDAKGKGEGRLSIATKIIPNTDGKYLTLEDYSAEPVRLQEVHVVKK
jgi:hypothetical protein